MIILTVLFLMITLFFFVRYRTLNKEVEQLSEDILTSFSHPNRPITKISNHKSVQRLLIGVNIFVDRHREMEINNRQLNQGIKNTVTNLSHDLKTPLTVILGYTEITQKNVETIDQKELITHLVRIENQSKKLVRTINDYFDLNKLSAGEMKVIKEPIDVSELLREEILSYYAEIEKINIELTLDILENKAMILGDQRALRRIFSNLLTNAIRYGADGNYLAVKSWMNEDSVFIEVADRGKGILEENQKKIFDRLSTLEDATDKNYSGSGLGLAITKKLVESMNGKISLYSKPFIRTSFTIEFPKYKN